MKEKILFNYGIYRKGKYDTLDRAFKIWRAMLDRVVNADTNPKYKSYQGCSIVPEWLDYQTFAEWYEQHWVRLPNIKWCIDKDLLYKNNKIYGPDTCVMVPSEINNLIVGCIDNQGYSYDPRNKTNPYAVYISTHLDQKKHTIRVGSFPTIEEAQVAYKEAKQKYMIEVANQFKEYLEPRAYEALCNFHF